MSGGEILSSASAFSTGESPKFQPSKFRVSNFVTRAFKKNFQDQVRYTLQGYPRRKKLSGDDSCPTLSCQFSSICPTIDDCPGSPTYSVILDESSPRNQSITPTTTFQHLLQDSATLLQWVRCTSEDVFYGSFNFQVFRTFLGFTIICKLPSQF